MNSDTSSKIEKAIGIVKAIGRTIRDITLFLLFISLGIGIAGVLGAGFGFSMAGPPGAIVGAIIGTSFFVSLLAIAVGISIFHSYNSLCEAAAQGKEREAKLLNTINCLGKCLGRLFLGIFTCASGAGLGAFFGLPFGPPGVMIGAIVGASLAAVSGIHTLISGIASDIADYFKEAEKIKKTKKTINPQGNKEEKKPALSEQNSRQQVQRHENSPSSEPTTSPKPTTKGSKWNRFCSFFHIKRNTNDEKRIRNYYLHKPQL